MTDLSALLSVESAGILAACTAILAIVTKAWPLVRRLARFLDDVQGEPARQGYPARPGWGERLATIEQRQDGTHDRLDHALERLDSVETGQHAIITRLARVESTTDRVRAQTENSHSTNLRDDLDRIDAKVTDLHEQHIPPYRKARP